MTTIAEYTLSRLVAQTKPHVAERAESESVQVLIFEYDGIHLYAWATNRYTLAVARTKAEGDGKQWTAIIDRKNLPELQAAIRLLDKKPVTLEHTPDHLVLSGESGTRVSISIESGKTPLDWRKVVHPAIERKTEALPMALNPQFFGAWKNLPGPVSMWSTGENQAALVMAADFIGLQMPIRRPGGSDALARELDTWRPVEPVELPAVA
ncbi:hypothetical protein [Streptomyces malaysiensis]|uniref:hypothetical protein n=1 Tax=Streptomyces malaysiensis TaxID=92644 RepID=UPI0036A60930